MLMLVIALDDVGNFSDDNDGGDVGGGKKSSLIKSLRSQRQFL
jgi:hypothetical protein